MQLLAGARVSDIDNHQRGAIHMAVEGDFATILSVLLEHAADPDIVDEAGNNGEWRGRGGNKKPISVILGHQWEWKCV